MLKGTNAASLRLGKVVVKILRRNVRILCKYCARKIGGIKSCLIVGWDGNKRGRNVVAVPDRPA